MNYRKKITMKNINLLAVTTKTMKTPKEKAKELHEKCMAIQIPYMDEISGTREECDMDWEPAIECAKLCVAHILDENPDINDSDRLNHKYWKEVNKELDLLK